jgi:regulator of nucleoside diphosphate kinase
MGSVVTYLTDGGDSHTVRLVYPDDATQLDHVSTLSPLGTALLGVSVGDTIQWSSGGRPGAIRVLAVCGP